MSSESIVIIVIPRDRFSIFPQCLEALYAHTRVPFRVIVVAGGTDEVTKGYLHHLQVQKDNLSLVLVDRLLMQGEARNLGIQQADEKLCVVLENDTIVHENWLTPMLECMREEGAAVVMPLIWWYGRILQNVLPDKVARRRSKFGFWVPQDRWLCGGLRPALNQWLDSNRPLWNWMDRAIVRKLAEETWKTSGRRDEPGQALVRCFMLDKWIEVFDVN